MTSAILTRIVATLSLLGMIAASIFAHEFASADVLTAHAKYWSALTATAGFAGTLLRGEARHLHVSRQLLIAR